MDYKVIYRKYRPNSFDGLIGQEYIKKTLLNALITNKHAHAYIFSGPRGTGKTSTAKIFAKAINCNNPINGNPCGECDLCSSFESSPDIIEIDAASNNGVDEIRELINNIKLAPSYSKYKIYIIDEVHMLSTSAFNALLLTLEGPSSLVVFILSTTDIQNVPITVLSRCQRYDFKPITIDDLVKSILKVAKEEKIKISTEAAEEIAYISDGGLRDAYSILDQLSGSEAKIELDDVINTFGTISNTSINNLVVALENNDVEKIIGIMSDIQSAGINIKVFIEKLMVFLKNYAIKIKINPQSNYLPYQKIKDLIMDLNGCINNNRSAINPYNLLEVIILDYVDDIKNADKEIVLESVAENTIKDLVIEKKSDDNSLDNELISARINNAFVNANKQYLRNMEEYWQIFINDSKIMDKKLYAIIVGSKIVVASECYAIIVTSDSNSCLINNSIDKILKSFNEKNLLNYLMIAVSESRWNQEKTDYLNNKKKGIEYTLIDESLLSSALNESEAIAQDLFGEKLEIN